MVYIMSHALPASIANQPFTFIFCSHIAALSNQRSVFAIYTFEIDLQYHTTFTATCLKVCCTFHLLYDITEADRFFRHPVTPFFKRYASSVALQSLQTKEHVG